MTGCLDPECKNDLKRVREHLYGDGPEGTGGVYGALKTKVGFKAFSVFMGIALLVLGWVMLHENRISKVETMISSLCREVDALKTQNTESTKKILHAIDGLRN
jgi:hypothetical protein